ncbi:hypothetical protein [Fluviicola taffensis]|uniref:hypothetical protein n=1 Tax=Fluviicola taffensis TaxID=191579 RepID=UPI003137750D
MKKYLWISSLSLFVLACFLPVYGTSQGPAEFGQGLFMFVLGWMEAFSENGAVLSWFANPFFIIALCTTKKFPVTSVFFAAFAILTALCFLKGGKILLVLGSLHYGYLTQIRIGYWLWLGSMVVILFASIFKMIERKKEMK